MNLEDRIEIAAAACHMANRAYCIALGDHSQPIWEAAPDWQRNSAMNGVRGVMGGNTPRESHEGWLREKEGTGWKYGPIKDVEAKVHPCFVPYDQLPPEQQRKDSIFVATAETMLGMLED